MNNGINSNSSSLRACEAIQVQSDEFQRFWIASFLAMTVRVKLRSSQ